MSLRSLLIIAPGALLLIAALAFVFVNKDDGHGHDHHGHSHGAHSDHDHDGHSHGSATASTSAPHDHAGHSHSHGGPAPQVSIEHSDEWRAHYSSASLPLVFKSLLAARDALRYGLDQDAELPALTRYAETIHLTAHALLDQVVLPQPAEQQRLNASLAQTAALADALLEPLHHSERAAARTSFSRLNSAIGVVSIRLPELLQSQAEQLSEAPIFAPAPAHNHAH